MSKRMRPTLGGGAILFTVACAVLLVLDPPSLSGAGQLLTIAAAVLAVVLVAAWVTVTLLERDGLSEPEFERVVQRTERLAEEPAAAAVAAPAPSVEPGDDFEEIVASALDRLPEEFRGLLETTPVIVSKRGHSEGAYGQYYGDTVARDDFEDCILLYRDTLERDFGHDHELLSAQVERTLRHELAHHLGWEERGVQGLGL